MESVKDRFLRYVKIDTQSQLHVDNVPSTDKQLVLCRLLRDELIAIGAKDVALDPHGYVTATIPANVPAGAHAGPLAGKNQADTGPRRLEQRFDFRLPLCGFPVYSARTHMRHRLSRPPDGDNRRDVAEHPGKVLFFSQTIDQPRGAGVVVECAQVEDYAVVQRRLCFGLCRITRFDLS